jgi:hypothetical protein
MVRFDQGEKQAAMELISAGMNSSATVRGLTHGFYKYPARFSPQFVRTILDLYSNPGDIIIDPFVGSGTTIVESLAGGRTSIGVDLNPLAHFIAKVKTTPLSEGDKVNIVDWVFKHQLGTHEDCGEFGSRVRNLPRRIQRVFEPVLSKVDELPFQRQRGFVRCLLLKCAQWGLDCRRTVPSVNKLNEKIKATLIEMLDGLDQLVDACKEAGLAKKAIGKRRTLLLGTSRGIDKHPLFADGNLRAKLVLTSPPYPGVHILYHRWQIGGRRETPAPFWLAGLRDGQGEAFYTLGGRSQKGIVNYFNEIALVFGSIRRVVCKDARVIQLLSFTNTRLQLPRYLQAMETAGFALDDTLPSGERSLMWRKVPNRKWYSQMRGCHDPGREVLLIHRPK